MMNKLYYIFLLPLFALIFADPPQWLDFPDSVIDEDCLTGCEDGEFLINLEDFVIDPDLNGEIENISIISTSEGGIVSLDGSMLSIEPDLDFFGDINILLRATDIEDLTSDSEFILSVLPINDPPSFTAESILVVEEEQYTGQWALNISAGPTNESNQETFFDDVSWESEDLIDGWNFTDGFFIINPVADAFGQTTFEVTLNDTEGGQYQQTFTYEITPENDSPVIDDQYPISYNEDCDSESCNEFNKLILDINWFSISDVDHPQDSLSLFIRHDQIDLNYETDGDLGIIIDQDYFGDINVPVYVVDTQGAESSDFNCEISILPINDPPTFNGGPNIVIDEDNNYDSLWVTNISAGAYNEIDELNFVVNFEFDSLIQNYSLDSDGFFSISPTLDYSGETDFEIYLDDGDLQSQSQIFNLEIRPVNDIPEWNTETLNLLDKNIYEDCESVENINFCSAFNQQDCDNENICEWVDGNCEYIQDISQKCEDMNQENQYVLNLNDFINDVETNLEDLEITILQGSDDATSEILDQQLIITPDHNFNGQISIYLLLSDGEDNDIYEFILNVIGLNDNPIISQNIPDLNLVEDFESLPPPYNNSTIDLRVYFEDQETSDVDLVYTYNTINNNNIIDIDIDNYELTIEKIDNAYTRENWDDNGDGLYNGEEFYDDNCNGLYDDNPIIITITAIDNQSRAETSLNFNVNVTARNDQSFWSQSPISVQINEDCGENHNIACTDNLDSWYSIDLSSQLNTYDNDQDCINQYEYTIENQTQNGQDLFQYDGTIIDSEHQFLIQNEILYIKPKFNFNGILPLIINANDNNEEDDTDFSISDQLIIRLSVNSINDGPYFNENISDINVDEFDDQSELIDQVNLYDIAYDQEYSEDGLIVDDLYYFYEINPEDVGYVNYQMNSEGVLEIIPINNYNGTINFTVTIDDEPEDTDFSRSEIHNSIKTFDVIVEQVNDIPIAIITSPDNPNWIYEIGNDKIMVLGLEADQEYFNLSSISAIESSDIDENDGLNAEPQALSYYWEIIETTEILGHHIQGNQTDMFIGLDLAEGVYLLQLTVSDPEGANVTDQVEIRVGRNKLELDENYTFVNTDETKNVNLTISDGANTSVYTSGNVFSIHLPNSAINDGILFTPLSIPSYEIITNGDTNDDYELIFIPNNQDFTKLTWRLDRSGFDSSYNDFLPNDTEIKINQIELLTSINATVSEFNFDLIIENSFYESFDEDLDALEYLWVEDTYPNQIKNISVGRPLIYLSDYEDKYNNIFSDWSFTKNDHYPTINITIEEDNSAGTIEDEFIIKINDDASSSFKFLPPENNISNSLELDLSYELIDSKRLKVTHNNGSIDNKNLYLELSNIALDFNNLDIDEYVDPVTFELFVNDIDNVDAVTNNTVRVGQPTLSFDNAYKHEIFVLTDGSGNLSEFTYHESNEVASAQGYIEIVIRPDENGNTFKFSDLNITPQYLSFDDGSGSQKVSNIRFPNGNSESSIIVIDLIEPLEPGEFIKIGGSNGNGLHITDFTGEVEETFLYVEVNQSSDFDGNNIDSEMGGDDHIRIGNPSLNISDNQVFLKSDSINPGCDELALNQITIEEGNVPVIRSREGIKLTLPPHLIWDPDYLGDLEISGPSELDIDARNFIDNNQTLFIPIDSDSYLSANDIITIDGAYVIPVGTLSTPAADDPEQHITLYVNDKKEDFDNNLAYTNNGSEVQYLAVDDIEIYFESNVEQQNNDGDISYALDNGLVHNAVSMPLISIESITGNWPVYSNRDITVVLPDNIHYNSLSDNGWTNNEQNNNELKINSGSVTAITISGTIDIAGLQSPKEIQVFTNSKSRTSDYSGSPNLISPKTLRVGDPRIKFDDTYTHQLFPLNDGAGTLSTIIYKEDEVAASASDWIMISHPNDIDSFDISDITHNSDKISNIFSNGTWITIELNEKLEPNEEIEISNLRIVFDGEMSNQVLHGKVNSYGHSMFMEGDDFIRIGNPSIDLADSQVFILSDADQLGCDELALNTITIQESDNPIIRGRDGEGIKITLPEHLKWDSNYITSLDIQVPDDKFEEGSQRIVDDGHSLLFDLINEAHLLPQDIITIDGAYVIPQSLSPLPGYGGVKFGLSVNDKVDDFDTYEDDQSSYIAVDDFQIKLYKEVDPLLQELSFGGTSNTNNASFVISDNNPSIGSIQIQSISDLNGNYWPSFKDRQFQIRLPENISFNSASSNLAVLGTINNNKLNFDTYDIEGQVIGNIEINGEYSILAEQAPDFLKLSTNNLSIQLEQTNAFTDEFISVGSVSLMLGENSEDHDIFIRRDNTGILSKITYSENGINGPNGCAVDYIRLRKPDGFSFTYNNETPGFINLSGSSSVWVEDIEIVNEDLIFVLSEPLSQPSELIIEGIEVEFSDTEVDETYLEIDVNQFLNFGSSDADSQMQDNNHVRIGNPQFNVGSNQIFLMNDQETLSDRLIMSDIIIEEGAVPVVNPYDNIVIYLPENIEVASELIEYDVLLDESKIQSVTSISNQILIEVSDELSSGEKITITNLRINPRSYNTTQEDIDNSRSAFVGIELNSKINDSYIYDYYASNFSAVDELIFDFTNDQDQALVLSDMDISGHILMSGLYVNTVNGKYYDPSTGIYHYTLVDRPMRFKLPDNIDFFNSNTSYTINPCDQTDVSYSYCNYHSNNTLDVILNQTNDEGDLILGDPIYGDLGIIVNNTTIPRTPIELTTYQIDENFLDNPNVLTEHTLRVGQPTIDFVNSFESEVFISSDYSGILSNIIFKEDSIAASATDNYGVKIKIHDTYSDDINIDFIGPVYATVKPSEVYDYENNEYNIDFIDGWDSESGFSTPIILNTSLSLDSETERNYLHLELRRPLVKGEYIEITDLGIFWLEEGNEESDILLKSYVNEAMPFEGDGINPFPDAIMDSEFDAIRIGQPSISLSKDKVFILSDPIPSSTTELPDITITEGNVPIIRKFDLNGLNINLPSEMEWRNIDDIVIDINNGETDEVNYYLDIDAKTLINPQTLNIPVLNDFSANQSIIIQNGKIKPLSITQSIENELSSCTIDVNDKKNDLESWSVEDLMVNDIQINFISQYEHEDNNGQGSHSFVLSDQYGYLSNIEIRQDRLGDDTFDSNIFDDFTRKFSIEIPDSIYFASEITEEDILCDGMYEDDNIAGFAIDNNKISFFTNIDDGCDVLSIQSPKVMFNNIQDPNPIKLYTTFEPIETGSTSNTISVGQPIIEFLNQDMGEVFALIDEDGYLNPILYQENSDAATAVDYIDFDIPFDADFTFSNSTSDLDQIDITSSANIITDVEILNDDKTLRILLSGSSILEGGDWVRIENAKIIFNDAEVSKTLLEMNVNSFDYSNDQDFDALSFDAIMSNMDNIRIGNPHLDISEDHVFILSDPENCNELKLSTITLSEGSVPIINSVDNILIKLPSTLKWSGQVTDLSITGPNQLDINSAAFQDDDQSLFIPLINGTELVSGNQNIITINNASVKTVPNQRTCVNDTNARLSAYVNSKKDGYDNKIIVDSSEEFYNHYLAVDDIMINFSSADFSNTNDVAYVQSDQIVAMDEITIKTVNSEDICYDWPVFKNNRNFILELPDYVYFSEDINIQNTSIDWSYGSTNNIIEFTSDTYSTEIKVNGTLELDQDSLQNNESIKVSTNSLNLINKTSTSKIRTGDPKIYFLEGREMFASQQEYGILGPITYIESTVPSAIDYIDFDINLSETFLLTFSDNTDPQFSGTGLSNIEDYDIINSGRTFRVNLNSPMGSQEQIVIRNLSVNFSGQVSDYYLELNVNNDQLLSNYDYKMSLYDSTNYIRVGSPSISSSADHVFIGGENQTRQAIIETIEIKSGTSSSTINADDNIQIIIPEGLGLSWDSNINNFDQNIYLSGSAYDDDKIGSFTFVNDNTIEIDILEDFEVDDNLIIDGAYENLEGFLFVNINSDGLESSDRFILKSCDNTNDGNIDFADEEDEYNLIVAKPTLSIPQNNLVIVTNRSDIVDTNGNLINSLLYSMEEVVMVDGQGINSYPTIKAGQYIKISLASDDAFVCGQSSYFYWDSDLLINPPEINVIDIFGSPSSNEIIFSGIENNGKTIVLQVLDDLDAGDRFNLEGFNVYAPTCKLIDTNDGIFTFTIRNDENATILNSVDGLYKISNPEIYSLDPQIYFDENDNSNIVTLRDIVIKEDSDIDSDLHVLDYNNVNSITITLPPEASWNTLDDYLEQNGPDQGAVNSQVEFLDNKAIISLRSGADIQDSVVISGLTFNMNNSSSSTTNELNDFITFSFNEGLSQNLLDKSDFFIGEINFSSLDENIILKGDTGEHLLNMINITPSQESLIYGDIYGYRVILPPELQISFADDLIDNPNNTAPLDGILPNCLYLEGGQGQACEYLSDCLVPDDPYVPISLDNCLDGDKSCKTLEFAVSNGCANGQIIFPSKVLKYNNQSNNNSPSIASNLIIEPILIHPDETFFESDTYIKDLKNSFLDAVTFYSENHNRILLNYDSFSTNEDVKIHNIHIKNADNPILEVSDTISISLENTNCNWAENINTTVDYPYPDIVLINDLNGNYEFNRDKDLVFKILTDDIPANYNDLDPFIISNLHVTCEDISEDNNKIKLRNYEDIPNGQDLNFSFYGLDTKQTSTDAIKLDIPNNSAVWLDGTAKFIFDSLSFNKSDLFINDSLSFYLDFGNHIKFTNLNEITDLIDVSGFSYTSITTNNDSTKLGFNGVNAISEPNSTFTINNLLLNIDSDLYLENNFPINKNLKLVIPNPDFDNYVKSDNQFKFLPSLFFSKPSLYNNISTNESFMEFCVYNNWNLSDDDTLYFDINKNYVPLYNESIIKNDNIPEYIINDLANYELFNNSSLELWTYNLNDNVLDSINIIIDSLIVNDEQINLSIFKNYDSFSLARSNSSDSNGSDLSFYPGIDPVNAYLFTNLNRALNPDLDVITMKSLYGNTFLPKIKIQSIHDQSIFYEINQWNNEMVYLDSLITIDIPSISNNFDDGIYNLSLFITDPNDEEERSSIPLSRYYYFDRAAPDIFDIQPWDGLNIDGLGHDITIFDDVTMTLIDSSVYFNDNNNLINHIIKGEVDSLNLNHILANQNFLNMKFYLNDTQIEGRDINDTLIFADNFLSNYEISLQNVLSGLNFESKSEFKILLELKDQANNVRNHEISYIIQKNEDDMLSHFINYPNPFSPLSGELTYFRYSIVDQNKKGNLVIYDLSGNLIYLRELNNDELTLGTHEIAWNGKTNSGMTLADGVYFALIDFDGTKTRVHKVAVINEK